MQSIEIVKNQSLLDLSIQLFGTDQAAFQLYLWNREYFETDDSSLDVPIREGMIVHYYPEWPGEDRMSKLQVKNKIIATYGT